MINSEVKKLYYDGTDIEVLKGDYVIYKTAFLRRKRKGRVSYIPKLTGRELAKQGKDTDEWIIEFEDKTVAAWIYVPEELQPSKRVIFIKRGDDDYSGITSEELEKIETSESNQG